MDDKERMDSIRQQESAFKSRKVLIVLEFIAVNEYMGHSLQFPSDILRIHTKNEKKNFFFFCLTE